MGDLNDLVTLSHVLCAEVAHSEIPAGFQGPIGDVGKKGGDVWPILPPRRRTEVLLFCFFLEKSHSFENVLHLLLGYPRGSITSALCPRETPRKGAELGALGMAMGAHR